MKPALLIEHANGQRRAQIATAEALVALYDARMDDARPGTPEYVAAIDKFTAARIALRRLQEQPTLATPGVS